MYYIFIFLAFGGCMRPDMTTLYNFATQTNVNTWRIVNDDVMGGRSESTIGLTPDGHGKFAGHVSLANYGGFASVQLNTDLERLNNKKFIVLRVKGDGKRYEFRLKGAQSQAHAYVHPFSTSGEWETIRLEISSFYPQFRGQRMNIPNFNFERITQMSFLIANKQEEDFTLLIDWIGLE